jgi:DNA processing protein
MLGIGAGGPLGAAALGDADRTAAPLKAGDSSGPVAVTTAVTAGGDADADALAILVSVDGLGPATLGRLLATVGGPSRLLALAAGPGARALLLEAGEAFPATGRLGLEVVDAIIGAVANAPRIVEAIRAAGLRIVTALAPAYPARLRQIGLPPHVLFVAGEPGGLDAARSFAVVGTRHPTEGGRRTAARIAAALARSGASVVSGLAIGIDGAAHAAVVAEGGRTIAVLGGGHRQLYPRAHAGLADAIVKAGGAVISEFPPDVTPRPGTFPRRNRLISGLSEATIVIEAGARSGALTTAAWALEQGRGCFLVPGAIDATMSAGCLAFLREYPVEARIVAGVPQLLADLGLAGQRVVDARASPGAHPPPCPPGADTVLASLRAAERNVAAALIDGFDTVDELVASTDLPVGAVLAALTLLEGRGLVVAAYGRYRASGLLAGAERGPGRRPPSQPG